MPRTLFLLIALASASPAIAAPRPFYYGPLKQSPHHDVGYAERVEKDGRWRIEAGSRDFGAIDIAMYRAAERARDAGYRYVQFLRGTMAGSGSYATVWVRPAATADAPPECQRDRHGGCYVADAAEVMRRLSGADGAHPGVAVVDHYDKYGRPVQLSGFGIGAVDGGKATWSIATQGRLVIRSGGAVPSATPVGPAAAAPQSPAMLAVATPPAAQRFTPAETTSTGIAAIETQARFDAALRAQQPVRGRNVQQGWTISD